MPLITIVITLIIVGILLYLVNMYIPMDATIKKIINIVAVILSIVWVLRQCGLWTYIQNVKW